MLGSAFQTSTGSIAIMAAERNTSEIELAVKFGLAAAHTATISHITWLVARLNPQPGWETTMIGPISSRIRVLIHLSSSHHLKIVRGALEWRRSSLFMKHLTCGHPNVTHLLL
jgi:hypothetical protein